MNISAVNQKWFFGLYGEVKHDLMEEEEIQIVNSR